MEINRKHQSFHSLLTAISILLHFWAQVNQAQDDYLGKEFNVGVILDMGSLEWEIVHSCMSMAISDFYNLHNDYATRVVLHARDSKGEPLRAFHAALDLLGNTKVEAIIGAQTSIEANFLAELGEKAKVPVISFFAPIPHSSLAAYPYFIQVREGDTSQVNGIAAIIEKFNWKYIIFIHEDTDDGRDILPYLVDKFQKKNIHISYKIAISASSKSNEILEELHKVMASQTVVFVVHLSYFLASSLCINAKRSGMMGEGYAWIMTSKSMNDLHFMNSSVIQSMQGVIGFRSHIPASEELDTFTSRWREKIQSNHSNLEALAPGVSGVWAYDVCWSLAHAAERVRHKAPVTKNQGSNLNSWDLDRITTSRFGPILLREILQSGVQGLSGKIQFIKGKLAANTFEIVNVIGRGERTVGFWSSDEKLTRELQSSHIGKVLSSTSKLEDIIWPGGSANIPEGRMMQMSNKKLRVGIPVKTGFTGLVDMERDPQTNETTVTGFSIDVFKAAIEALSYPIPYEFIPFEDGNGQPAGTHNELVYQVYLQNFDAVVGDVTIMANRSLYVDFTISYTDMGLGVIVKNGNNMWIFLRPLTADLWLTSAAFFIFTGFIIWAIERPINDAFRGSPLQQIATVVWFSLSTLTFAQRERLLSNLSKLILIVWLFAVLILTSSYTATLASMLTVQQINLSSKEINIGYQSGSYTPGVISNLNFEDYRLKPYTLDGYAEALSRGSKSGGVSAIIDEMPYIKIFLSKYAGDGYSFAGYLASTNGFGFAFPKGSPLVPEISRQIMALREEGKLRRMESAWFPYQSGLLNDGSATSNNLSALNLDNFGGLFIITGSTSCLAFVIFFIFKLHKQWRVLRNYDLRYLFQKGYEVVNTCFNGRIRSRAQETSVL